MATLYLCGAGNPDGVRLALRVNQRACRWSRMVVLDDDRVWHGRAILGVPIDGGFDRLAGADPRRDEVVNLVARTTAGRRRAFERIAEFGVPFAGLVSGDVDLLGAEVAGDALVYPNANIGAEARIGRGCVVFMGAAVGHESRIGEHCVIASNSVLNARVELGSGVYVGSGAIVLPEVRIGAGATIGAGAVVLDEVNAGATVLPPMSEVVSGPAAHSASGGTSAVAGPVPADAVPKLLLGLAAEVLGVEAVRADQNFFDLGGSSLLAMRLLQRIREDLGIAVHPVDLFRFPTVSALAVHLGAASAAKPSPVDEARLRADLRRRARMRTGSGSAAATR